MSSLPYAPVAPTPWVHGLPQSEARPGSQSRPPRNARASDMDITGSILTATLPRQQTPTEASSVMPLLAALRSALTSREMSHLADAAVTTVSDPAANARSTPLPMNVGDLATGDGQIQREPIAMPIRFGGGNRRPTHCRVTCGRCPSYSQSRQAHRPQCAGARRRRYCALPRSP